MVKFTLKDIEDYFKNNSVDHLKKQVASIVTHTHLNKKLPNLSAFTTLEATIITSVAYNELLVANSWYDKPLIKECERILRATVETDVKVSKLDFSLYRPILSERMEKRAMRQNVEKTFNESAPDLKLDEFSLAIFTNFLATKKKLTGADALRYLKILGYTRHNTVESQIKTHAKYCKLIWDNTPTKSVALVKHLSDLINLKTPHSLLPFANNAKSPTCEWSDAVGFSWDFYESKARELLLPRRTSTLSIIPSEVHYYVSGVPKKTPMTNADIHYALDKVPVLQHLIATNTHNCPYYRWALDQIVSELSRKDNYDNFKRIAARSIAPLFTESEELLTTITKETK